MNTLCEVDPRARDAVKALSDVELLPQPAHRPDNSKRLELSNVAIAERIGVGRETVRRARYGSARLRRT